MTVESQQTKEHVVGTIRPTNTLEQHQTQWQLGIPRDHSKPFMGLLHQWDVVLTPA